ncbi:hypothetical protein F5Y07DRAFT_372659 [Xylaria sp. FL0933]|nr:hypothetical protein F5Y07DRAFT_372659 [Xylaria sp. FL0933]
MDTLKKVADKGKDLKNKAPGASSGGSAAGASGHQQDYGDKGAEFLNKKYMGDRLSSDQREQMTDAGRQGFEKATGQKVPEKFSQ